MDLAIVCGIKEFQIQLNLKEILEIVTLAGCLDCVWLKGHRFDCIRVIETWLVASVYSGGTVKALTHSNFFFKRNINLCSYRMLLCH